MHFSKCSKSPLLSSPCWRRLLKNCGAKPPPITSRFSTKTIIDPTFGLTPDQLQLQSMAYQFGVNEFRPYMKEWDEKEYWPRDQVKKGAELGFCGLYVREEDGGTGLSRFETYLVFEALAQSCVSTTAMLSIHNMCAQMVSKFGSDALKQRFLPDIISFDKMCSYCLTEPGSGSDSSSLSTTAIKKDKYYLINGAKAFISGGGESDLYVVMCRTGKPGAKGISCILIEKGTKGLTFGKKEQKLGWNSQPTRMVIMEDCMVPEENLVGHEGQGFHIAMDGLNGGRVNISACSLGGAQRALEEAIQYTSDRKQFKQPILAFQNTQFKLASLAAELLSARLMVRTACRRIDAELSGDQQQQQEEEPSEDNLREFPLPSLSAAAKLMATEKSFMIIDQCLQLFGGYGYLKDFPIQQLLRDTRVHRILEGTNEIMQLVIARDFIKKK